MSEYYESLDSIEKAGYIAKLEAVGLTLEDDSNSNSGRIFVTNGQLASTRLRPYFWLLYHSLRFVYYRKAPILETAIDPLSG